MEHRRGILFMLFLIFWWLMFIFVLGMVFAFMPQEHDSTVLAIFGSPFFIIFQQIMLLLVPLGVWLGMHGEKLTPHLPHIKLGSINTIYIVMLSLLLQPIMMTVSGITTFFFPNEVSEMLVGMRAQPLWLMLLAIAVTPAICEEVVFRGYIQSTYKSRPFWQAALVNGLFFGIIHFNPQQFPYAFGMGIIFAYMVYITRSIRAGVISHFIMNASQVTLLWIVTSDTVTNWMEYATDELAAYNYYDYLYLEQMERIGIIAGYIMVGLVVVGGIIGTVYVFRAFALHNQKRFSTPDTNVDENPEIVTLEPTTRKDRLLNAALILAIVVLYVFFIFVTSYTTNTESDYLTLQTRTLPILTSAL